MLLTNGTGIKVDFRVLSLGLRDVLPLYISHHGPLKDKTIFVGVEGEHIPIVLKVVNLGEAPIPIRFSIQGHSNRPRINALGQNEAFTYQIDQVYMFDRTVDFQEIAQVDAGASLDFLVGREMKPRRFYFASEDHLKKLEFLKA